MSSLNEEKENKNSSKANIRRNYTEEYKPNLKIRLIFSLFIFFFFF